MTLISEDYRAQQRHMHQTIDSYGSASVKFAPLVTKVIDQLQVTEVLDYGSGKGRLAENLRPTQDLTITMYEPSDPELSNPPEPHEFVACIDVLEHIEPDCLDDVLDDLKRVAREYGMFTVHTGPAGKVLPDGRNAHLIQKPDKWWLPKFTSRFELLTFNRRSSTGFWVVVKAL